MPIFYLMRMRVIMEKKQKDESPKQLISEVRKPIKMKNGSTLIFISNEPLTGRRTVKITERKTKTDWAVYKSNSSM